MNMNFFLFSSTVPAERLSWIEESLKFFFVQLFPETLTHQKTTGSPVFVFFLTGDALYSLTDPETLPLWNVILSFPPVRIICDRHELDLRGISTVPLKMRFPDQLVDTNTAGSGGRQDFWRDLAAETRQTKSPLPGTAGWLQTASPYMNRSAWYAIRFLSAATDERLSTELYAYLDGIHMGHHGQNPPEGENVGRGLAAQNGHAVSAGLTFTALGCNRSAAARGYSTWDDGKGQVISTCTERVFRIRDISRLAGSFRGAHPILSADSGAFSILRQDTGNSYDRAEKASTAPPVTLLVTHSPYSTGFAAGAVELAVACAHAGILTRVIFVEDGVWALAGNHRIPDKAETCSIPRLINAVAGNTNLHFFAFTPSFQKRGIQKDKSLAAVLDIGYPGLGKILFFPPGNVHAEHQRVWVF